MAHRRHKQCRARRNGGHANGEAGFGQKNRAIHGEGLAGRQCHRDEYILARWRAQVNSARILRTALSTAVKTGKPVPASQAPRARAMLNWASAMRVQPASAS